MSIGCIGMNCAGKISDKYPDEETLQKFLLLAPRNIMSIGGNGVSCEDYYLSIEI